MRFALLRRLVLASLACAAGCGHGTGDSLDQGMPMACPSGVEGSSGYNPWPCSFPWMCQCTCSGYWECDEVLAICGDDGGV